MEKSIAALKVVYRRAVGRPIVDVWDTNFGYIICSEKAPEPSFWRRFFAWSALAAGLVLAGAIWAVPSNIFFYGADLFGARAAVSALFASLGALLFLLSQTAEPGIELHVDTSRQELRAAAKTPAGETWIHTTADFDMVSDIFLRRPKPEVSFMSLCLRLHTSDTPMPVAVGDEATLLQVHDKLAADLRPVLDPRLNARTPGPASPSARSAVFPQLGPDEQNA